MTNLNHEELAEKAIDALDRVEGKILNMLRADVSEGIITSQNIIRTLPESMASKGVLITSIVPDKSAEIKNIVYLPVGGEIRPHFHEAEYETIIVLLGCVKYRLYESDRFKKVIKEGEICEGERLDIDPMLTHYVFTTVVESYLRIDFSRRIPSSKLKYKRI